MLQTLCDYAPPFKGMRTKSWTIGSGLGIRMYGRDNVELALLAVEEGMSGREAAEPAARTRKAAGGGHATDHDFSAAAPGAPAVTGRHRALHGQPRVLLEPHGRPLRRDARLLVAPLPELRPLPVVPAPLPRLAAAGLGAGRPR